MKLIRPTTITDAMLISCDVPETDYAAWSAATTYALGDKVIVTTGVHKIYESLQATNLNHDPTTSPDWWLDSGATNRWKMFDAVVGSQTSQAESLSVTLQPGIIDSIAFLDVEASTISVTMTDPTEGVVYTETIDLVAKTYINDGWSYFFEPIILDDACVLLGIPPYGSAQIAITITNTGSTAKIGTLIVGAKKDLGGTQYDPTIGITDYSKKEVDVFGNYSVVQRAYSKRMGCSLIVQNSSVDDLVRTLASYRATPICWVGDDQGSFSSMIIYGFYKSFEITIPGPEVSSCSMEIEGLS